MRDWANDGFVDAEKAATETWKGQPAQLQRKSGRAVSRQLGAESGHSKTRGFDGAVDPEPTLLGPARRDFERVARVAVIVVL